MTDTTPVTTDDPRVRRRRRSLWQLPLARLLAVLWLVIIAIAVIAPGVIAHLDPDESDPISSFLPPSGEHWFGTDQLGRDLFARVVYGARYSITIALLAVLIAVVLGTILGLVAALGGGIVNEVVSRLLDLMSALPSIMLALVLAVFMGRGVLTLALAVGLAAAPGFGRIVRRQVLSMKDADFVVASRTFGDSQLSIIRRHILPNVVASVVLLAAIEVGASIMIVSGISFLGLGPQRPAPEWGSLLSEGRDVLSLAWWPTAFPGLAIVLTVLAVTVAGRALQRRAERRSAR